MTNPLVDTRTLAERKSDLIHLFALYRNAGDADWARVARLVEPSIDAVIEAARNEAVLKDVTHAIAMIKSHADFAPTSILTPEVATGAFAPEEDDDA